MPNTVADEIVSTLVHQLQKEDVQLTPNQIVELVDAVCRQFGGMMVYIPKVDTDYTQYHRQQLEIREAYRKAVLKICRDFNVSQIELYRSVKGKPSKQPLTTKPPRKASSQSLAVSTQHGFPTQQSLL